jgi:hypothetical protein
LKQAEGRQETVCGFIVSGTEAHSQVEEALDTVMQSIEQLAWSFANPSLRTEFRVSGSEAVPIKRGETFNFHGSHVCIESGTKYKYYGDYNR